MEYISIIIALITLVMSIVSIIYSTAYKRGEYDKRLERLEEDNSATKDNVAKLHDDMIRVLTVMQLRMRGTESILSAKNSPRQLNDLGGKLYSEMNGAKFLTDNESKLFSIIDKQSPKTAFDVEGAALFACNSVANDDIFNPIKQFIYNCPTQKDANGDDYELTLDGACFILSLPLRDAYLQKHPNIK